jgi:hypothetical protein
MEVKEIEADETIEGEALPGSMMKGSQISEEIQWLRSICGGQEEGFHSIH